MRDDAMRRWTLPQPLPLAKFPDCGAGTGFPNAIHETKQLHRNMATPLPLQLHSRR